MPMQAARTVAPRTFRGDDEWVRRHLTYRDAECVKRDGPGCSATAVETVRFDRVEFTKQIQVRRSDRGTLLRPDGRGLRD